MKKLIAALTVAMAAAGPVGPASAAPATTSPTQQAAPVGLFPPEWCDAGRTFFAPVLEAMMPLFNTRKDLFGPGEVFLCGEQKTVPKD
jgi:hypothetical protein